MLPAVAGPERRRANRHGLDLADAERSRNAERRGIDLAHYPHLQRWHDAAAVRPAVRRGVQVLAENRRRGAMPDAEREVMFGRTQSAVR
jgi:GST-like protein